MRPIRRGGSPQPDDFTDYRDALPHLVGRLGSYCSYCERRIATNLAVEHIQPKNLAAYRHLIGRWENFLLACVNCNSTKKDRDVVLADILIPDRDNTFSAFIYSSDGKVAPARGLSGAVQRMAEATLSLTGLDKAGTEALDENDKAVALDRVSQRMQAWAVAEEALALIQADPGNRALRQIAVRAALGFGFFSIWMTVFAADTDMRDRLIEAFAGTGSSGCFDSDTTLPVSPAPNPDNLPHGSKI
jgi:uncharacterized protein (TIGR02646 family)